VAAWPWSFPPSGRLAAGTDSSPLCESNRSIDTPSFFAQAHTSAKLLAAMTAAKLLAAMTERQPGRLFQYQYLADG
jgi:hypothetical protein